MQKTVSKSIVITGVSTGIGYGVAKQMCQEGFKIFGSVRKQEDGDRLKAELGENFVPLVFDVTDNQGIIKAAEEVENLTEGMGIGGLINNAGIAIGGPLQHIPIEEIKYQFEVNVIGLIQVTQAFLPLLGARKDHPSEPGKILNISSVSGKIGAPFVGPYVGTKFAVEGISHSLRRELQLYGIEVVIIGPGSVTTPIWKKSINVEKYFPTAYENALKKVEKFLEVSSKVGYSIDEIGQLISNIYQKEKPAIRYALVKKRFKSWTLPRLFPSRMIDRIIGKNFGLTRK